MQVDDVKWQAWQFCDSSRTFQDRLQIMDQKLWNWVNADFESLFLVLLIWQELSTHVSFVPLPIFLWPLQVQGPFKAVHLSQICPFVSIQRKTLCFMFDCPEISRSLLRRGMFPINLRIKRKFKLLEL